MTNHSSRSEVRFQDSGRVLRVPLEAGHRTPRIPENLLLVVTEGRLCASVSLLLMGGRDTGKPKIHGQCTLHPYRLFVKARLRDEPRSAPGRLQPCKAAAGDASPLAA